MVHVKKCHPAPFADLRGGWKTFEFRREDDCRYEVDDVLILLEFRPAVVGGEYTGELLKRRVTYVLRGKFGVPEGYAVLALGMP